MSTRTTVVLASASAGRLAVLRAAGIEPTVLPSRVDEDVVRARHAGADPAEVVKALAEAKAVSVAADTSLGWALADAVVIGADSMLRTGGELQGKPHTRAEARRRWQSQMGTAGDLLTGHCVVRVVGGDITGQASATAAATVRMGTPTQAELDAYLDSGEPLEVAGGFTIDGLGGWFVDGIDGDPSCVVGLSLPTVRRLLAEVGVTVTDLWEPLSIENDPRRGSA